MQRAKEILGLSLELEERLEKVSTLKANIQLATKLVSSNRGKGDKIKTEELIRERLSSFSLSLSSLLSLNPSPSPSPSPSLKNEEGNKESKENKEREVEEEIAKWGRERGAEEVRELYSEICFVVLMKSLKRVKEDEEKEEKKRGRGEEVLPILSVQHDHLLSILYSLSVLSLKDILLPLLMKISLFPSSLWDGGMIRDMDEGGSSGDRVGDRIEGVIEGGRSGDRIGEVIEQADRYRRRVEDMLEVWKIKATRDYLIRNLPDLFHLLLLLSFPLPSIQPTFSTQPSSIQPSILSQPPSISQAQSPADLFSINERDDQAEGIYEEMSKREVTKRMEEERGKREYYMMRYNDLLASLPVGLVIHSIYQTLCSLSSKDKKVKEEEEGEEERYKEEVEKYERKKCGESLSKMMLRIEGVRSVIKMFLTINQSKDDRAIQSAVRVISSFPSSIPKIEYLSHLSPIIRGMIKEMREKSKEWSGELQVVVRVILRLMESAKEYAMFFFIYPSLRPFYLFFSHQLSFDQLPNNEGEGEGIEEKRKRYALYMEEFSRIHEECSGDGKVIISEEEVDHAVDFVYLLITCYPSFPPSLWPSLSPVMKIIFQLYSLARRSKSNLKWKAEEILKIYFTHSGNAHRIFKEIILSSPDDPSPSLHDGDREEGGEEEEAPHFYLTFQPGESGGVLIKRILSLTNKEKREREYEREAEGIIELLKQMKDKEMAGNLFIEILIRFQILCDPSHPLHHPSHFLLYNHQNVMLLYWLAKMIDEFGVEVLKNLVQVTSFIKAMLSNRDEKIVMISLVLLSTLLNGEVKISRAEEILLYELVDELDHISYSSSYNEEMRELASSLRVQIIASDKKAWRIPDDTPSSPSSSSPSSSPSSSKGKTAEEELKEIMELLGDPLMPVRAHGLIQLRHFILGKSSSSTANRDLILDIFKSQLNDTDSYVYGIAINGLTALGDLYPALIIPILSSSFANFSSPIEYRLKISEAILLISQRCGEMLPHYAKGIVHIYLLGCKEKEEIIKASSLSNLAEICKLLRFALHPYLIEILSCVSHLLQSDPSPLVQRGLGVEAFEMIPDELQPIYRQLRIAKNSPDPITALHATSALDQLSSILHDFCLPQESSSPLHILR